MLLIAVSYGRSGWNVRAKLDTVINSLSAKHAYLKTLYVDRSGYSPQDPCVLNDRSRTAVVINYYMLPFFGVIDVSLTLVL